VKVSILSDLQSMQEL